MPKKTTIREGASFGYFDRDFEECRRCKLMAACYTATKSDKVEEIRAIPKIKVSVIDELARKWTPENALTIEEIDEIENGKRNAYK